MSEPALVVFRGLPGTGKSFLARKLLQRKPELLVLSRDELRVSLIPVPAYSKSEKAFVDELILDMARLLLGRGKSVVIDGMALSRACQVERFAALCASLRCGFHLVECVCPQEVALRRIASDGNGHPAADRGAELYARVRARFEPTALPHLTIDTDRDAEANTETILQFIAGPSVRA